MFRSHPSFGRGGHFLSAQMMKRLWKKHVSIEQPNIVMQMSFKVCECIINFSGQKNNYNNITYQYNAVKNTGLFWMWYYGTTVVFGHSHHK